MVYKPSDMLAHPWPTQFLAGVDDESEDENADHNDHENATQKSVSLSSMITIRNLVMDPTRTETVMYMKIRPSFLVKG